MINFLASVGEFNIFLKNLSWTLAIDILVLIAVMVGIFFFFKKQKSMKVGIMAIAFAVLYLTLNIITALTANNALYITKRIADIILIFVLIVIGSVYQTNFKAFFAKLTRAFDRKQVYSINTSDEELRIAASEIVTACQTMAKNDVGALIVIAPTVVPAHVLDTGTQLNALVSRGLLESIFITKGPLHDGAVVVKGDIVLAAGCFLPLSQETNISKELGTRHRAAIGITEESDVLAIVVSEETGIISVVQGGRIRRYLTPEKLFEQIESVYGISYSSRDGGDN